MVHSKKRFSVKEKQTSLGSAELFPLIALNIQFCEILTEKQNCHRI